jgi:hypothetical protein
VTGPQRLGDRDLAGDVLAYRRGAIPTPHDRKEDSREDPREQALEDGAAHRP